MRRILLVLVLLVGAAAAWLLRPPAPVRAPEYLPAASYDEAFDRLAGLMERDTLEMHPGCGTTALVGAERTPRAFVLLHGITNCPLQFLALAESLRTEGDNVIVPRVPRHGRADRMTGDLANLRAEELAALVTECVGIAHGLGDTVIVCGLSTSGVAAAWAAANVAGVDRAVVIAPAFAPPWKPAWLAPIVTRLALHLPNRFVWWNDAKQQDLDGPAQCYPRFPTRAMGECYRLGEAVMRALPAHPPAARAVAVVTTEGDRAIDNDRAHELAVRLRTRGAHVIEYAFPASAHVVHDMIDPVQVGQRIDVTYPVLLRLLRGGRPAPATGDAAEAARSPGE